ncbi:hypothetical protein D3C83_244780 [compost metagenome]
MPIGAAGQCWRYPAPVARHPSDLCGEHQAVRQQRDDCLARRIANALMSVPAGETPAVPAAAALRVVEPPESA